MYDYNNDYAGREHHNDLLIEAAEERLARSVEDNADENIVEKLGALVNKAVESITSTNNVEENHTSVEANR